MALSVDRSRTGRGSLNRVEGASKRPLSGVGLLLGLMPPRLRPCRRPPRLREAPGAPASPAWAVAAAREMAGREPPAEPVARAHVSEPQTVPSTPGRIEPLQEAEEEYPVKVQAPSAVRAFSGLRSSEVRGDSLRGGGVSAPRGEARGGRPEGLHARRRALHGERQPAGRPPRGAPHPRARTGRRSPATGARRSSARRTGTASRRSRGGRRRRDAARPGPERKDRRPCRARTPPGRGPGSKGGATGSRSPLSKET